MRTILDLLRKKQPKSAELRQALAGLAPDDAGATLAALQAERRAALLDGLAGEDVETIERKIADVVRERDRVVAFREELTERLAVAEQIEAIDALQERKLKAEVESRDIAKQFAGFDALLGELGDMLKREQANANECAQIERELEAMGSTERVVRAPRATRPPFCRVEAAIFDATRGA